MKLRLAALFTGLLVCQSLVAQESAAPQPAPPPAVAVPEFAVLSRTVTKEMATEAAPLAGMVPVTRERTVTVDLVADPHLPAPPPPAPPADPNDPSVIARRAAFKAAHAGYRVPVMIGFSATTYDFTRTRLVWRAKSRPNEPITAWSNIPFTYIRGHGTFVSDGRKYMLLCGFGAENSAQGQRRAARLGVPYVPPVLPDLPELATAGPTFVITTGDATGTPVLEFLTALHAVYPAEAPRLKAAYEAREMARKEHETWVRAHPPEPQDIHVRFWEREEPVVVDAQAAPAKGGRP